MSARRRSSALLIAIAVIVSLPGHFAFLVCAGAFDIAAWWLQEPKPDAHLELVSIDDPDRRDDRADADPDEVEEEPEPEKPPEKPLDVDGQLVEIAPPVNPERPEDADYLAEYDQKVAEETRSERYVVNPEVLANRWSPEPKIQMQGDNVDDLDMTRPSTGARLGSDEKFDAARDGMLASAESKWKVTNRDGLEDPVPASALESVLAGAPQNDRLREKKGAETSLNTKEFLYASYLLRIRRLVNFYWNQNLSNLPNSVRLSRPEYTTTVRAVLDGSGALESVEIKQASGSPELDDAVERAFRVAGPYPNPPAGLISPDGRVYLPDMGFTVELGVAQMSYEGVDPRAGVQFPGILKSPR